MAHEQNAADRFGPPAGLDASKGIALYVQLADLFRHNVLAGTWPGGHRLDSFETLAAHYGVARITVRQAVARLVQEGLLSSQRGRGTVVLEPAKSAAAARVPIKSNWPDGFKIDFIYKGRAAQLPAEFQGGFKAFGSYVEVTKIHTVHGVPFAMVRIYVAEEVFKRFPRRAIEKSKILRLVFAHGQASAAYMRQRMTVEPSDIVLSQHLQYAVGSPVAKVLRQIHGDDQRLSYAGISWYRGDSFEMDMTLPRALIEDSTPALIAPAMRGAGVGKAARPVAKRAAPVRKR